LAEEPKPNFGKYQVQGVLGEGGMGRVWRAYDPDLEVTVAIKELKEQFRDQANLERFYREAQIAAIAAVRVGASCGDVDAAARQVLAGYKLDRHFTHSTGHGLGLEVHEDPRLARGQKARLEPGFVVTIEPGVYMAGVGGIRIEDDVAVLPGNTEVLTRIPRDLIEL